MGESQKFAFHSFPRNVTEMEEWAQHSERLGAELIGLGEAPTTWEDPYIWLAQAARSTSRLRMGPWVTAPALRRPAVLANTMVTLQRFSEGRAFLGMGTGYLSVIDIGEKPAKLLELVDYATAVRGLCRGETVTYQGNQLTMRITAEPVPFLMAADGPKALELAGRFADGVIVGQAFGPESVEHVLRHVGAGAEAAGRSLDDIEIWYTWRAHVTPQVNGAIELDFLNEYIVRLVMYFWRTAGEPSGPGAADQIARRKGVRITDDLVDRLAQFGARFSQRTAYQRGSKENLQMLEELGLRDWAAEHMYASGPVAHVASVLQEMVDAGGRNFIVPLMLEDSRLDDASNLAEVFRFGTRRAAAISN